MSRRVLIVGAGVSGLACARDLAARGVEATVLERSRGLGGRCATRRVEGQPVDHGVVFLHGSHPEFVAELEAVTDAVPQWGWPARVVGEGTPCQPEAFKDYERRVAFDTGVNALPKHLARGQSVEHGVVVVSLHETGEALAATDASGRVWEADDLVLALPAPQSHALLEPLEPLGDSVSAARALLSMLGSHPALALLAGYPLETPAPRFDVCYPSETAAVHLIAHDSAKRSAPRQRVLVVQARPCWSARYMEEPSEAWSELLLAEVAELAGDWVRRPLWRQAHRWRLARADRGMELRGPMVLTTPAGARVGLCGEVFSPGTGVEAAYLSGRRLARRLLGEQSE